MKTEKYYDDKYVFPFIAFIPENIGKNPALIIQLHGVGERGNGKEDLEKIMVHGLPKVVNDENLENCIMVAPQCPDNTFWVAKIESLKKFIDAVVEKYNIDTNRIYLCGLSMGGYGTWFAAQAYPEMFAAVAPCCGGGMVWYASVLKMPIWAFHGEDDDVVPVSETIKMVDVLKNRNKNFKYTIYKGVKHNSWDYGFNEDLIKWLLSHKK